MIEFAEWVSKFLGMDIPEYILIHTPINKILVISRKGWVWIDPNKEMDKKPRVILGAHPDIVIFDDMVKNLD